MRVTDRQRPTHCNANQCGHSSEVKKIYLREIAVGTDSDFPPDRSRSSAVEKSRRIAFEPTDDRAGIASDRVIAGSNNRYISNDSYQSPRKHGFYNGQYSNNEDARIQKRFDNKYNGNAIDKKISKKQQNGGGYAQGASEETEYTPVPVKQLIQEFEKTCRPVLQYKQISPKIIPIVQQCPPDNDIARFFETRTRAKKYNSAEEDAYAIR